MARPRAWFQAIQGCAPLPERSQFAAANPSDLDAWAESQNVLHDVEPPGSWRSFCVFVENKGLGGRRPPGSWRYGVLPGGSVRREPHPSIHNIERELARTGRLKDCYFGKWRRLRRLAGRNKLRLAVTVRAAKANIAPAQSSGHAAASSQMRNSSSHCGWAR